MADNVNVVGQVGFTKYGFYPKRLSQIIDELQLSYRDSLGDDIRTDKASVLGNIIAPESVQIADLWELVEIASHTLDARYATDVALDNIALLVGITRQTAVKSYADIVLSGNVGVIIPKGTRLRDANFNYWATIETTDIKSDGTGNVVVEAENFGEINASANTINQILDPVSGLASATNPVQAVVGRDKEADDELRKRIFENSTAKGVGSYNSLLTALENVEGVSFVKIIENDTMTDTAPPNIIKAKSFMVVIAGGDTQDIGDTIWYHKPAGIATNGTTGVDVSDMNGDLHNVDFQRPNDIDIYLDINISPKEGITWTGAYTESIKANVVSWASANLTVGNDVINSEIYTPINEVGGMTINYVKQGTTANPTLSDDIPIGQIERSVFFDTNISVTVV